MDGVGKGWGFRYWGREDPVEAKSKLSGRLHLMYDSEGGGDHRNLRARPYRRYIEIRMRDRAPSMVPEQATLGRHDGEVWKFRRPKKAGVKFME